uniref:Protein kinase domain-containing protein n=1 Tax=Parascaris univalens TaxID=6257 RepID=A0A915BT00_PARUN
MMIWRSGLYPEVSYTSLSTNPNSVMQTSCIIFLIYMFYVFEQSTLGGQQPTVLTPNFNFSDNREPSFTGTCSAINKMYDSAICQQWKVDLLLALRVNTTKTELKEIANFVASVLRYCDHNSTVAIYNPVTINECPSQYTADSDGFEQISDEILFHTVPIIEKDEKGIAVTKMFNIHARCSSSPADGQGAVVFFITNIPCEEMSTKLYDVIIKQRLILDELYQLDYLLYMYYMPSASARSPVKETNSSEDPSSTTPITHDHAPATITTIKQPSTKEITQNPPLSTASAQSPSSVSGPVTDQPRGPVSMQKSLLVPKLRTDEGECNVASKFQYFHTYAQLLEAGDSANAIYTCPLKRGINDDIPLVMVTAIVSSGVVVIVLIVILIVVCRRCKRKKALARLKFSSSPITSKVTRSSVDYNRKTDGCMRYSDIDELKRRDEWEIASTDLLIHWDEVLGKGAFAVVYKGTIKCKLPVTRIFKNLSIGAELATNEVAVKTLSPHADEASRTDFFNEIQFMKNLGYHAHVVSLIGCIGDLNEPRIILEYFANGDLLRFLRNHRNKYITDKSNLHEKDKWLCLMDLISIAWQVCDGMCYLSARNYVHRDIAARNVLLTKTLVAKVGDFGLCRHLNEALYTTKGGRLPIKWMAIESLKLYECTTKSDVWSYGVFLFELFSMGDGPFPGVQPADMIEHLESGHRNKQPVNCPNEIYDLMQACWQSDPGKRPSFSQLSAYLRAMLKVDDESNGYLNMKDADLSRNEAPSGHQLSLVDVRVDAEDSQLKRL